MPVARCLLAAGALLMTVAAAAAPPPLTATDDPYVWLEDKDGPRAMAWVAAENARTLPRLQDDPHYAGFYRDAYAIAAAQDRIPNPSLIYGRVLNFWRDAAHPHGIWRWTTPADFRTATPNWTTLIDVDALGKAEGKTWVWKGVTCLAPEERRCLVALSDGGEDAVTYREFDLAAGSFVKGGFDLPISKQQVDWLDADTLIVARDWGAGTMTASGYPFVVKTLRRGAPLASATEVIRGDPGDQLASSADVFVDADGNRVILIDRGKTFFAHELSALTPKGVVRLKLPEKVGVSGIVKGQVILRTSEDWTVGGRTIAGGALLAVAAADLDGVREIHPTILYQPGPRQAVEAARVTRGHVIAEILDEVRGRAIVFTPRDDRWDSRTLALPDNAAVTIVTAAHGSDDAYLQVAGFLDPTTLWSLDATTGNVAKVKALPARFDASNAVVEQYFAISSDGTRIPYFIVHRRNLPLDGSTPTIMTAYGGFEIANTPGYSGSTGKLWIERGGSFVLANIRGGGEFGPAWHEAGRKTKRQLIYDDFAAVARDVFARKLSSPAKLGIYGGSNGGLLMGVAFNQHPDLWHAVTIQVPLLDMLRYEHIQAGASWVDEYGSVSVPAERAFLATISPYANLRRGGAYPEPYIWTTTKDDRVGPQHARKFAARMAEYGLPYLFYEDTAGGHSGDADIAQGARLQALQMVYFTQKLMAPTR